MKTSMSHALIGIHKSLDFLNDKWGNEILENWRNLFNQILKNGTMSGYLSCSEKMKEKDVS